MRARQEAKKDFSLNKQNLLNNLCRDAVKRDDSFNVMLLLSVKAAPNFVDQSGHSLVCHAVLREHYSIIRTLQFDKADVDLVTPDGMCALKLAFTHHKNDMFHFLLRFADANPNKVFIKGEPILHYACRRQKLELVDLLLRHKADPNIDTKLDHDALATSYDDLIFYKWHPNACYLAKKLIKKGLDVSKSIQRSSYDYFYAALKTKRSDLAWLFYRTLISKGYQDRVMADWGCYIHKRWAGDGWNFHEYTSYQKDLSVEDKSILDPFRYTCAIDIRKSIALRHRNNQNNMPPLPGIKSRRAYCHQIVVCIPHVVNWFFHQMLSYSFAQINRCLPTALHDDLSIIMMEYMGYFEVQNIRIPFYLLCFSSYVQAIRQLEEELNDIREGRCPQNHRESRYLKQLYMVRYCYQLRDSYKKNFQDTSGDKNHLINDWGEVKKTLFRNQ